MIIGKSTLGNDSPPYIIAELSGNHNGDIQRAFDLIKAAKECGANAVKIQTYTPDTMTIDSNLPDFQIEGGLWHGQNLYQLYQWAHTPWEWHQALFEFADKVGITIFSSPFDETAVDLLEQLNTPAYKIASFELTDTVLIEYVAKTGKPIIMSTGMADYDDINLAISTAKQAGASQIALLHCISGYPTPIEQANLNTLKLLQQDFDIVIGLSDHTLGTTAAIAATALGACIIEKHFTLKRSDGGPDAAFSLEPHELAHLCEQTHAAWQALGKANYTLKVSEQDNVKFRRSIYAIKDIQAGEILTTENIKRIRPGYGLAPKYYHEIIGKKAAKALKRGEPLKLDSVID
jgi:N-acetylneuraminate synthase